MSPPTSFSSCSRVEWKASCTKNSYKICLNIFPFTLLLNQKRFYKKRSHLDKSKKKSYLKILKQNPGYPESWWKFMKQTLTQEKKSNNLYEGKCIKRNFALSRLLVSDFLLFNALFWSSIKKFKVPGCHILESLVPGPGSWVPSPGFWVLNLGSWVTGPGSQVLGSYFRLCC